MDKNLAKTLGVVPPKHYMIKISKIGFDTIKWGLKGEILASDPIDGSMEVIKLLATNWAKGDEGIYLYHLAVNLLAKLDGFDEKDLLKHIKETREQMIKHENTKKDE